MFKPGDKVKCISLWPDNPGPFVLGSIYTVKELYATDTVEVGIYTREIQGNGRDMRRFVLAEPQVLTLSELLKD